MLSATDLTRHLACAHTTTLDLAAADGALTPPAREDEALELIFQLGLEHEKRYLDALRAEGRGIVEIPTEYDAAGRRRAQRATLAAMRAGVDVVYQAAFFDGAWGGQADFLIRDDGQPSSLGPWSYEVADTKLARRMKVAALLQMALYADHLERLQGAPARRVSVVTGDGCARPWRLVDVAAFARRARGRLRRAVEDRPDTEAVPVAHCAQCRWYDRCRDGWWRDDDLSLVAFMRADHRQALREAGVRTLARLAGSRPEDLPRGIGAASRARLVQQARLQLDERRTGRCSYELLPPAAGTGLLRLPEPDPWDVYLDFEGDPYADDGEGREYLAGLGDRDGNVTHLWAHDRDAERRLTAELVDRLLERWRAHPGMHVYHYAPYETSALRRLTARHGVREAELDELLRGTRFVDLYAAVRQGLRISKPSYSIKKLEAFYWSAERSHAAGGAADEAAGDVADALSSVVAYERWQVDRDDVVLDRIASYNRDDVVSTRDLHDWLEGRRAELVDRDGPQERPTARIEDPNTPRSDEERAELELADRLRAAGAQLLADLVQWHRREARPAWWEVYRVDETDAEDLVDDATPIGGLSAPELIGREKRSNLWEYRFPPQDTRLRVGDTAEEVGTGNSCGTVFALDAVAGRLVLKRQGDAPAVTAVRPLGPLSDKVLRGAVARAGEHWLAGGLGLARAVLDRCTPPGTEPVAGETPAEAVVRVGRRLDGEVLAVQGPPGSGKTRAGVRLIRALLDDGLRVGVTATSHAVIGKVLADVGRPALQRCAPDQHCGSDLVEVVTGNGEVADRLADGSARLVGGTAWLWAREELRGAVDVLVVDEAGQFSLANAVAVAGCGRSMVLLGDPQQLAQPSQALHPDGAGASALEHLLDGHATVPPGRGIFLDTTWRMHPALTGFVSDLAYEGKLRSAPGLERQAVGPGGPVTGSGLRVVPVAHTGNSARSTHEAAAVEALWRGLQGVRYTDATGTELMLGPDDILIVAPFNNQVAAIRDLLPEARVGTVDRFQGQEAPVVLYSMTSSTAADAPRGIGFLYDLHRLNVAVSRARALAVVVMSEALLDASVTSPEQLRRVNALCRLAELAQWVPPPAG